MSNALWTKADEHMFNEMQARRRRVLQERRERLATALANTPGLSIAQIPTIADALVLNAREVHAALEPWVLGDRESPELPTGERL